MGKKLIKIMEERACKSKDPKSYIEIAKKLYQLMGLTDDEFIKEMEW
jgi:hypothetical protein